MKKILKSIKNLFIPSVAKRYASPKLSSFDKLTSVTNQIDDSWLNLKKVIDKCPEKSVIFFRTEENGWQLEICATYL
jgi:hypothetical protein